LRTVFIFFSVLFPLKPIILLLKGIRIGGYRGKG